jgi:hypothetical protein
MLGHHRRMSDEDVDVKTARIRLQLLSKYNGTLVGNINRVSSPLHLISFDKTLRRDERRILLETVFITVLESGNTIMYYHR